MKWRSLTNDELFQVRMAADTIYKNELSMLVKEAGYEIIRDDNGIDFTIAGFSNEQLSEFSERTKQRNEALLARGLTPEHASHRAREAAVLDSRAAKTDVSKEQLFAVWREKAAEVNLQVDNIVAQAIAAPKVTMDPAYADKLTLKALNRAIEHLSEREQAFKLSDLEERAVYFSGGAVSTGQIEKAIGEKMKERTLVDRQMEKARYVTTSEAVSQELTMLHNIQQGKGKGATVLQNDQEFDIAIAKFEARKSAETGTAWRLSGEQRAAAGNILMHSDKYQGVQGDAGTGKTAALEFVHEVARERGWEIKGLGTSTTAARTLEKDTGIESVTVASFMLHNDKQRDLLRHEIDRLAIEVARQGDTMQFVKQVERRDINLKGELGGFGSARYIFDNKTGNVYKSNLGPMNVVSKLGQRLQEFGDQRHEAVMSAWKSAETLGQRVSTRVGVVRVKAAQSIGRSLASYQKVGKVEAGAARDVHQDMQQKEFNALVHSFNVKQAQLRNLTATGHVDGRKFLLVMDETSLTGTKDSARLTEMAHEMGARIVVQGDIKQHGSVAAGRAFEQMQQAGLNLSKIEETRRFDNATPQTKQAIVEMKKGNYDVAIEGLDTIEVATPQEIYRTVAERYMTNREELRANGKDDPKVGIVTITNKDRKGINVEVRSALRETGEVRGQNYTKAHFDDPKLTAAQRKHVPSLSDNKVDRMTALVPYKKLGIDKDDVLTIVSYQPHKNTLTAKTSDGNTITINPEKYKNFDYAIFEERQYAIGDRVEARANIGRYRDPDRVSNGERGTVTKVDDKGATIKWDGDRKNEITFTNEQMTKVDHAYARTSYKEQAVTNDREIIAVSDTGAKVFNKMASYVAASRAKDNTEIVTNDRETMLKKAGAESTKTTAIDMQQKVDAQRNNQQQSVAQQMLQNDSAPKQDKGKEQTLDLTM